MNPFRYKPDKEIFIAVRKDISFIFSLLLFATPTDALRCFSLTTSFYDNLFSHQGIFCWCFFFPSLSQRVHLSLWRFAASWCQLVYISLFFSFLFAYLALYLCIFFVVFTFFTLSLFSAFLSSLPSFPKIVFVLFLHCLLYSSMLLHVCISVYMWGSYRAVWHTTDTKPRRGEEIICLSVTLPVNIRSRETEIAIITWSRCWHPLRGLCMCACQSNQWTAEDQWS